jgi:hypothetical protein
MTVTRQRENINTEIILLKEKNGKSRAISKIETSCNEQLVNLEDKSRKIIQYEEQKKHEENCTEPQRIIDSTSWSIRRNNCQKHLQM